MIPFKAHLTLGFASGVLLLISPWLFGFSDRMYLPHVILGAIGIGAVLMTRPKPVAEPEQV